MRYERTFLLQASHFNSHWSYDRLWAIIHKRTEAVPYGDAMRLLREVHGHNFGIVVLIEANFKGDCSWLVDDEVLEAIVMEWNNINISTHLDFVTRQWRATTECMALVLLQKLRNKLGPLVKEVRVYETDLIHATAGEN